MSLLASAVEVDSSATTLLQATSYKTTGSVDSLVNTADDTDDCVDLSATSTQPTVASSTSTTLSAQSILQITEKLIDIGASALGSVLGTSSGLSSLSSLLKRDPDNMLDFTNEGVPPPPSSGEMLRRDPHNVVSTATALVFDDISTSIYDTVVTATPTTTVVAIDSTLTQTEITSDLVLTVTELKTISTNVGTTSTTIVYETAEPVTTVITTIQDTTSTVPLVTTNTVTVLATDVETEYETLTVTIDGSITNTYTITESNTVYADATEYVTTVQTPATTQISYVINPTTVTEFITETATALPLCAATDGTSYTVVDQTQSDYVVTELYTLTSVINLSTTTTQTLTTVTTIPANVLQTATSLSTVTSTYTSLVSGTAVVGESIIVGIVDELSGFVPIVTRLLSLPTIAVDAGVGVGASVDIAGITWAPSATIGLGVTATPGEISATGISLPGGTISGGVGLDTGILPDIGETASISVNNGSLISATKDVSVGDSSIGGSISLLKRDFDLDGIVNEIYGALGTIPDTLGLTLSDITGLAEHIGSALESLVGIGSTTEITYNAGITTSTYTALVVSTASSQTFCVKSVSNIYLDTTTAIPYTTIEPVTITVTEAVTVAEATTTTTTTISTLPISTTTPDPLSTTFVSSQFNGQVTATLSSLDVITDGTHTFMSLQTNEVDQDPDSTLVTVAKRDDNAIISERVALLPAANVTDPNTILDLSMPNHNNSGNSKVGIIIGSVFGTLAAICIIVCAFVYFRARRRKSRKYANSRRESIPYISPFSNKYFSGANISKDNSLSSSTISISHNSIKEPTYVYKGGIPANTRQDGDYSRLLPFNNKVSLSDMNVSDSRHPMSYKIMNDYGNNIAMGGNGARLSSFPQDRVVNISNTVYSQHEERPYQRELISPIEAPSDSNPLLGELSHLNVVSTQIFANETPTLGPSQPSAVLGRPGKTETFSQATTIAGADRFSNFLHQDSAKIQRPQQAAVKDTNKLSTISLTQLDIPNIRIALETDINNTSMTDVSGDFGTQKYASSGDGMYSPLTLNNANATPSNATTVKQATQKQGKVSSQKHHIPLGRYELQHAWRPNRKDELYVDAGENVEIDEIFADGWCHGSVISSGKRRSGMFPLACLGEAVITGSV